MPVPQELQEVDDEGVGQARSGGGEVDAPFLPVFPFPEAARPSGLLAAGARPPPRPSSRSRYLWPGVAGYPAGPSGASVGTSPELADHQRREFLERPDKSHDALFVRFTVGMGHESQGNCIDAGYPWRGDPRSFGNSA